jgi:hypothetical protein
METSQEVRDEIDSALEAEHDWRLRVERTLWEKHLREGVTLPGDQQASAEARFLLIYMGEVAERYNRASWPGAMEYDLWRLCQSGPGVYGSGVLTASECLTLRWLSEKAGGWWRWSDEKGGPVFVKIQEWEPMARQQR